SGPSGQPGRFRDSRLVRMCSAASGLRHHRVTGCGRPVTSENILASAAPNAPAPNTAISMRASYQFARAVAGLITGFVTGRRVAVVDDDRDIRDALRGALTDEGYDVTVVPNGLRLLSALQVDKPDLIVLDVMMSWIDGFELCKAIKRNADYQRIPVMFISAK